jgi:hypothetical protein
MVKKIAHHALYLYLYRYVCFVREIAYRGIHGISLLLFFFFYMCYVYDNYLLLLFARNQTILCLIL